GDAGLGLELVDQLLRHVFEPVVDLQLPLAEGRRGEERQQRNSEAFHHGRPLCLCQGLLWPLRLISQDSVTTATEASSIRVEIAMMLGLMPCFTLPKMAVGRGSIPAPLTKLVMMKSSRLMMKASSQPEITPGAISGSSTWVKARKRLA